MNWPSILESVGLIACAYWVATKLSRHNIALFCFREQGTTRVELVNLENVPLDTPVEITLRSDNRASDFRMPRVRPPMAIIGDDGAELKEGGSSPTLRILVPELPALSSITVVAGTDSKESYVELGIAPSDPSTRNPFAPIHMGRSLRLYDGWTVASYGSRTTRIQVSVLVGVLCGLLYWIVLGLIGQWIKPFATVPILERLSSAAFVAIAVFLVGLICLRAPAEARTYWWARKQRSKQGY